MTPKTATDNPITSLNLQTNKMEARYGWDKALSHKTSLIESVNPIKRTIWCSMARHVNISWNAIITQPQLDYIIIVYIYSIWQSQAKIGLQIALNSDTDNLAG